MIECEKNALQDKVKTLQAEGEACCKLQNRIQQLESQISDTQLLLDKESAKYKSAFRQQEVSVRALDYLSLSARDIYSHTQICHATAIK